MTIEMRSEHDRGGTREKSLIAKAIIREMMGAATKQQLVFVFVLP
jgi:hypothetical protein